MNNSEIQKENPLTPAEDYEAMRSAGVRSIEQLGSEIWTDYNFSDPGITILEAVIYAITDLGYRTGFEVKDLLAPKELNDSTWNEIFYTARQILHNNPVTINDYRKLIIDIEGIRNAWLEPSKEYEVPVWVNYNYYEKRNETDCDCPEPEQVYCMGELNLQPADQAKMDTWRNQKAEKVKEFISKITEEISIEENDRDKVRANIEKETDPVAKVHLRKSLEEIQKKLDVRNKERKNLNEELEFIGGLSYIPSKIVEFEGLYNVMIEFEEDVTEENRREEVRQNVTQKLLRNRNICEDFLSINMVSYSEFGIGASIMLEENADPDEVLAQIFFTIYKYFTPSIPFYSIDQMLEKGYRTDEIFEGPALKHGFIDDVDLEKTVLFRDIRLSDLIHEIVDNPGVKAITYLHLPFNGFDSDKAAEFFKEWIHSLKNSRKVAKINPEISQVIFCKESEIITYNTGAPKDRRPNRMLKLFNDLKTIERKYKLTDIPLDLPVPRGENMELDDYYPVTYSLPMTYGVSERAGLPVNADGKRKVQALQLKGYLLFFEQLLFDYLVNLNHLRDLYTMDDSPEQATYGTVLEKLQDISALILKEDPNEKNPDIILQQFSEFLRELVEPRDRFFQKRNTFLNHFLARFGEDVSEYESISRFVGEEESRLVKDKVNMLKNKEYKRISSGRAKGFNYADPEFWETGRVSGTERRISRLLGFRNIRRRNLVPDFIVTEAVMSLDKKKQAVQKTNAKGKPVQIVKILSPDKQRVLITSVEVVEGCCTEDLIQDILTNADINKHLKVQDLFNRRARRSAGPIGEFWFELYDGPNEDTAVLLAESDHFENKDQRDEVLKELTSALRKINENEGLHLVEHILLRPRFDEIMDENNEPVSVSFPTICLQKCDLGIGLDEGDIPLFKKKISRIPAQKCYDNMPWILEYIDQKNNSILFQSVTLKEDFSNDFIPLKFRRYSDLSERIEELDLYGSDPSNYVILSNQAEEQTSLKYGFSIQNEKNKILAQSLFVYNKRTKQQIADNVIIENDIEKLIGQLAIYFGTEADWYCEENPCDHNEDPFSFRTTLVLPCWPKRFRNPTFKNLIEKTIAAESPAHVQTKVLWLGMMEMKRFEQAYYNWLQEMSLTEIPSYEKVNPLVDVLNTLQACGSCKDDCNCGPESEQTNNVHEHSQ